MTRSGISKSLAVRDDGGAGLAHHNASAGPAGALQGEAGGGLLGGGGERTVIVFAHAGRTCRMRRIGPGKACRTSHLAAWSHPPRVEGPVSPRIWYVAGAALGSSHPCGGSDRRRTSGTG